MASPAPLIDTTTLASLLSTVAILAAAYTLSLRLLPTSTPTKTRALFIWHAFDALIHFCLEGGYLYNCFFSYASQTNLGGGKGLVSAYLPPNVHFLGNEGRLYGAEYGTNPLAALWREYAKADHRWGGSDLTIISLELLTVLIEAPLAVYICYLLTQQSQRRGKEAWFWMLIVAVGEIYGGWMTFAPEWLSGSPNLEVGNWMYKWVYLAFFNLLWVFIPGWVCYECYQNLIGGSAGEAAASRRGKKRK